MCEHMFGPLKSHRKGSMPIDVAKPRRTQGRSDTPDPLEVAAQWERLTDDERELLIPRLLSMTKLGARLSAAAAIPFTPRY